MEETMQDSQKTKDELWNRLWKEFGQLVYMEGMNDHVKEGANGDLVDFIVSEISKAREEGYKKGREDQQHLDGLLYVTTVATTTTLEEGWKLKDPKELKKELSKLTTK